MQKKRNNIKKSPVRVDRIIDWLIVPYQQKGEVRLNHSSILAGCDEFHIESNVPCINCNFVPVCNIIYPKKTTFKGCNNSYKLLTLSYNLPIKIDIFSKDKELLCSLNHQIVVILKELLVVYPDQLTKENIFCKMISCENEVHLKNDKICFDFRANFNIEIADKVIYELEEKNAQPRLPIPLPPDPKKKDKCFFKNPICCPSLLPPPPCPPKKFCPPCNFEDNICGDFCIDKDSGSFIVWEALGLDCRVWGSFCISIKKGDAQILVVVNDTKIYDLKKGQTISFTSHDLHKIELIYKTGKGKVSGRFALDIHYCR